MTPEERSAAHYSCTYRYQDSDGRELFIKKRYTLDPPVDGRKKTFELLSRTANGGLLPKFPNIHPGRRLLYGVPELIAATRGKGRNGPMVYLMEGERDVDTMRDHGLVATTYWQGAEVGMQPNQCVWLEDAAGIIIVRDNDSAGAWAAWHAYRLLTERLSPFYGVQVVRPRGRKRGVKDATNHFDAEHGVEDFKKQDLMKLAREAAAHRPLRLGGTRY
jgi:hypothetical protein